MNKTQEALKMAIEALEIAEQIEGYGLISFKKYGFKEDADILKKYRQTLQACKEALAQPAMTYEQGFAHGYEAHRVEQENDKQESIVSLWEALTDKQPAQEHDNEVIEVKCKTHPDAPHGFNRNESHSTGRYVCDCEFWEEPMKGKQNETA